MNRLEETRRILDSLGFMERSVRTGEDVEPLDEVLPSVETERSVRLARHLNGVLREVGEDQLSPELEHKIYNLRNEVEKEAIEVVEDRVEIDRTPSNFMGFKETVISDPVSKISFSVTETCREQMPNWRTAYTTEVTRSVVEP